MAAFSLKTFRLFTINFEKFDWSLLTNFEHRKFLHLTLQEDHFLNGVARGVLGHHWPTAGPKNIFGDMGL